MSSKCENCKSRARAEQKPNSFAGILWRWHTRWCPEWKTYQKELTGKSKDK